VRHAPQQEQPNHDEDVCDIENAYFFESGLSSVVAIGKGDKRIEVGIIGREGVKHPDTSLFERESANPTGMLTINYDDEQGKPVAPAVTVRISTFRMLATRRRCPSACESETS
jgi:hypothetical protein